MKRFHRKVSPIPDGFSGDSIRVESSICTGETVIGFYNPAEKKLCCAELVRCQADIDQFYAKYGLQQEGKNGHF